MTRARVATLLAFSFGLVLVLSSCSNPAANLDRTAAQSLSTVATQSDQAILGTFQGSFQPLSLASVQGIQRQATCSTVTPNPVVDNDGDGIPASETTTYNCSQATDGYDASGSISIQDHNDSLKTSGWEEHINSVSLSMSGFSMTADGDLVLVTTSTPYTLDANYTFSYSSGSASGSMTIDVHPRYTPANLSAPFAAGSFVLNGSISFSDGTHTYSLHRTSNNLTYDSAKCQDTFTGGTVTYKDGAGNSLEITYSYSSSTMSCSTSFTYNGQPL